MGSRFALFLLTLLLAGCCPRLESDSLPTICSCSSDYYLILYVSTKKFDYRSTESCLRSMSKNSRDGRFGHAWIYVRGLRDGQPVEIEGGHSGELGQLQPRYFDGVADLIECGDPNPIRYLWEVLHDGFFQEGSGGHLPTFAARIELTPEQFEKIVAFIQSYPYSDYALTGRQCTTFCLEVAALAGWKLEGLVTLPITSSIVFGGARMRLWHDPRYASITFASPDRLERSLRESQFKRNLKATSPSF